MEGMETMKKSTKSQGALKLRVEEGLYDLHGFQP